MSNLAQLQHEAVASCERRGHAMSPFTSFSDTRAVASCTYCGSEVGVNTRPMPNEIDIGGEAVALNCTRNLRTVL